MIDMSGALFYEQQRFISKKLGLVVFLTALALLLLSIRNEYISGADMIGPIILVLIAYLFYKLELTVIIRNTELMIYFPPLVKRKLPFSEINSCEARTYRPIREYGGWGIRYSWRGKGRAYTVKGNKGVQLSLQNGEFVLIGSQKAELLAESIRGQLINRS
ncbi:MAG: hypothetical protein JSV13_08970 [Nitrospiraceae bacterium]|jgi:hypothetical protein|nr:MAG: hypothetical protein JSV13_08970 [Nitrospiraceae bacterium]